MITVGTYPDGMSAEEIREYVRIFTDLHPFEREGTLDIKPDGEYVDLFLHTPNVKFERIRRITGYLTGTVDRWNNAKTAELHDRVKHDTERTEENVQEKADGTDRNA